MSNETGRKLIKINNEFSIYKDPRQWCTVRHYESKNDKGVTSMKEEVKYPGSIENCCRYIIQYTLGECETASDIIRRLSLAEKILSDDVRRLIEVAGNEQ